MRSLFLAVLLADSVSVFETVLAADGCGPGCHSAPNGGVVDGWQLGAPLRNECPAGVRPSPRADMAAFGNPGPVG